MNMLSGDFDGPYWTYLIQRFVKVVALPVEPLFNHLLGVVNVQAFIISQLSEGILFHVGKFLLLLILQHN